MKAIPKQSTLRRGRPPAPLVPGTEYTRAWRGREYKALVTSPTNVDVWGADPSSRTGWRLLTSCRSLTGAAKFIGRGTHSGTTFFRTDDPYGNVAPARWDEAAGTATAHLANALGVAAPADRKGQAALLRRVAKEVEG